MPVAAVADLEALLVPIEGENPAGENLRYEGTYDQIKEARRADEVLEQGEWERDLKVSDWPEVIKLATTALTTKSKDLRIGAWLAEAWTCNERLDRMAGLRDGLHLLRALMEQFWENVYPEIDPEDDEGPLTARANVLADVEGKLAIAVRKIPITGGGAGLEFSFLQWDESKKYDFPENIDALSYEEQQKVAELKAEAEKASRVTAEAWRKAVRATPRAFYEERCELVDECWASLKSLDGLMDEQFKRETPGLKALEKSLDEVRTQLDRLVKEKRISEPYPEELEAAGSGEGEVAGDGDGAVATGVAGTSGPIRSRQDALKRLNEVAVYFRKTEPHSPVAYLVSRAVRWGDMPLENWLTEVIKDATVLEQLRETLGIQSESEYSE